MRNTQEGNMFEAVIDCLNSALQSGHCVAHMNGLQARWLLSRCNRALSVSETYCRALAPASKRMDMHSCGYSHCTPSWHMLHSMVASKKNMHQQGRCCMAHSERPVLPVMLCKLKAWLCCYRCGMPFPQVSPGRGLSAWHRACSLMPPGTAPTSCVTRQS